MFRLLKKKKKKGKFTSVENTTRSVTASAHYRLLMAMLNAAPMITLPAKRICVFIVVKLSSR